MPLVGGRWCYLATWRDACSRRVVGWHLAAQMPTELVLHALEQALTLRQVASGLIIHADRGSQRGDLPAGLRYRDPVTEGYNPTPNFLISAHVPDDLSDVGRSDLKLVETYEPSYHYKGRLFDRDTLLLQRYNLNFLFVLAAYVRGHQETTFRAVARQEFRNGLLANLGQRYCFYRVVPPAGTLEAFVTRHFRWLHGMLYQPTEFISTGAVLLAVEPGEETAICQMLIGGAELESWQQRILNKAL